ncbi:MAG: HupE/UreJ family protein [Lewinella sp.]|nr:HupE/UreJ family protein [Lewinella sp.]
MQSDFATYLQLGFHHIADLKGYDHILFIIALCAIYTLREWKRVAILVTAFTLGHSLTLALAALNIVRLPQNLIEFLIPVTIVLTALYNVFGAQRQEKQAIRLNYVLALVFGLIHGMGFSNFFRSLLMPDEQGQLVQQLLAFNIGVELGQLAIVAVILLIAYLALSMLRAPRREWTLFLSGGAFSLALVMALERV